jgi:hypothetical protein
MYEWGSTETALNALEPERYFTPEQRARRDYVAMIHGGKPSPGPLRQRLAATLMKLAIALDGQAQAALAGQPVVSHR